MSLRDPLHVALVSAGEKIQIYISVSRKAFRNLMECLGNCEIIYTGNDIYYCSFRGEVIRLVKKYSRSEHRHPIYVAQLDALAKCFEKMINKSLPEEILCEIGNYLTM